VTQHEARVHGQRRPEQAQKAGRWSTYVQARNAGRWSTYVHMHVGLFGHFLSHPKHTSLGSGTSPLSARARFVPDLHGIDLVSCGRVGNHPLPNPFFSCSLGTVVA
jgi:hypothetical protein